MYEEDINSISVVFEISFRHENKIKAPIEATTNNNSRNSIVRDRMKRFGHFEKNEITFRTIQYIYRMDRYRTSLEAHEGISW